MTRFIQLHALTVYPPSNPNRDDIGRPKTASFGGVERLRISSQAMKRAIRTSRAFKDRVGAHRGDRTQRLGQMIADYLTSAGLEPPQAVEGARSICEVFGKPKDARDKHPVYIEQLAFISPEEREAAFRMADRIVAGEGLPDKGVLVAEVLRKTDTATDIAMFGRMMADNPDFNREAAVQVAHAITTHRVDIEEDFFTAVDDLKRPSEDAGAGFIGELGFGSGVFYVYCCIDQGLLVANLGGDEGLARAAIAGLIEGLATAAPTGKQASFASRVHASFLRIEKGPQQPRSLAAAFLKPIRADDLLGASIAAIEGDGTDRLPGLAAAMNRAYGSCFDTHYVMNVTAGAGSLADAIAFAGDER
ncbi:MULTISPECIES: type I-E CRISPR-associated protein Cas7/Cse4/CasC [Rhodomicrobium]|uniref:type I-E CRISPR-associated protein Cas7/Cse4/CasC n=1 Tax=Rhodomicrobium TaxID=1068 RepID=UPI000B4BE3D2|nr:MULTISPECIES: type I-E CRISPR-associated protein Cas7/Cse4/CasC [Rhodomicrobium]